MCRWQVWTLKEKKPAASVGPAHTLEKDHVTLSDVELVCARDNGHHHHSFPFLLLYHLTSLSLSLSLFSLPVMQGKIGLRTVGVSTITGYYV